MRCSWRKLRNINPDPASSTNERATSATTTSFRNKPPLASPSFRLLPRSTFITSGRAARHADAMPKMAAASRPATAVNASTAESIRMVSRRGRFAGAMTSNSWIPNQASARPAVAPMAASRNASASICRARCHQVAPIAARTASSRSRREARTSRRLATLAQAISRRKITAPMSARMAGRTSETRCCRIGSTRIAYPAVRWIGKFFRASSATLSADACARSSDTPSFNLPTA